MEKEYICIADIPDLLIHQKHVENETIESEIFEEKTYLNAIKPYLDLFAIGRDKDNQRIYPANVKFDNYLECNRLDATISGVLQLYIGCFEKRLRCFIIDVICDNMKKSGDNKCKNSFPFVEYLNGKALFDFIPFNLPYQEINPTPADGGKDKKLKDAIKALIDEMDTSVDKRGSHKLSIYYLGKYKYIPAYIALHTLSLGDLVAIFSHLSILDRSAFVCSYHQTDKKIYSEAELEAIEKGFVTINVMRNIINHYQPIFPYILNYSANMMEKLSQILMHLKQNYIRSHSEARCTFEIHPLSFKNNSYNEKYFKKVSHVINALL